jgi:hypothetical protein
LAEQHVAVEFPEVMPYLSLPAFVLLVEALVAERLKQKVAERLGQTVVELAAELAAVLMEVFVEVASVVVDLRREEDQRAA